jgi:predicted nucleotide-binding protein
MVKKKRGKPQVFVFSPNDTLRLRQKKYAVVRDNVVFELGLFVGKLGNRRTFIVVPQDTKDLRIPTDLTGISPGKFDAKRQDRNLQAALGPFCNQVRNLMKRVGLVKRLRASSGARKNAGTRHRPET